jgi:hypothetical protein
MRALPIVALCAIPSAGLADYYTEVLAAWGECVQVQTAASLSDDETEPNHIATAVLGSCAAEQEAFRLAVIEDARDDPEERVEQLRDGFREGILARVIDFRV